MTAAATLTAGMTGRAPMVGDCSVCRKPLDAPEGAIDRIHVACLKPRVCTIRLGKPDDLAFVVDSWVTNAFRRERKRTATTHVRSLLARPTSALYVAHVPGDADAILGWAVLESGARPCLHFVYVRSHGRRLGIARELLSGVAERAIDYSFEAPRGVPVPRLWTFNGKRSETK